MHGRMYIRQPNPPALFSTQGSGTRCIGGRSDEECLRSADVHISTGFQSIVRRFVHAIHWTIKFSAGIPLSQPTF